MNSRTVLDAMRAGASDFLTMPFDAVAVRDALTRLASDSKTIVARGRLIGVLATRGGSGASTVALNLANAICALPGHRALLVDLDYHSSTCVFNLKLNPLFNLNDAISHFASINEVWDRVVCCKGDLRLLPAPSDPLTEAGHWERLTVVLESAKCRYSCVVVDFPSGLPEACRDVFRLVDEVYLVATPEIQSLHLARVKLARLSELGVQREHIRLIVNRAGSNEGIGISDVAVSVGVGPYCHLDNDYQTVNEGYLRGEPVAGATRLGQQFTQLAKLTVAYDEPFGPTRENSWWSVFAKATRIPKLG